VSGFLLKPLALFSVFGAEHPDPILDGIPSGEVLPPPLICKQEPRCGKVFNVVPRVVLHRFEFGDQVAYFDRLFPGV
jgi:hypothetical protein